ncbi:MAG: CDP-2,3-bis-(O-geranylgeranyl)-sn-glycerol synthase [Candidatus Micrarchaeota archaeon]|nr:CDP-2,3-bis-(O-geranylgeranyl)-sn-glycerol synthase [Candidatus Micrarchaeota archaeon]
MDLWEMAIRSLLFILPSYFANATPVLLGGGQPLDAKRKFADGERVFGDGKTVRGFFAGICAAVLVGSIEGLALLGSWLDLYGSAQKYTIAGFLLGSGTMAGDLLGSFIKRRQKIPRGKPSWVMDQLMFLFFAIAFAYPVASHLVSLESVLFLAVLTYFVHIGANVLANRLGLKKVPW